LLAGKYLENQPQKLVAAVGNILRKIKGTAAPISEVESRNRLEINMFRVTAENTKKKMQQLPIQQQQQHSSSNVCSI
jgi:hypothetical protein